MYDYILQYIFLTYAFKSFRVQRVLTKSNLPALIANPRASEPIESLDVQDFVFQIQNIIGGGIHEYIQGRFLPLSTKPYN